MRIGRMVSRGILLPKGETALMARTPLVRVVVAWTLGHDYDVDVLVARRDGTISHIADEELSTTGAIVQLLDRAGGDSWSGICLDLRLTGDIAGVVPLVRTPMCNPSDYSPVFQKVVGPFSANPVLVTVDNGTGSPVSVDAADAGPEVCYACVPVIIQAGGSQETIGVQHAQKYSVPLSESLPTAYLGDDGVVHVTF